MRTSSVRLLTLALCTTILTLSCAKTPEETELLRLTRQFVAAYNAHDAAAMTAMVTEDIRWMNVAGNTVSVETSGRAELRSVMQGWFSEGSPAPSRMRSAMQAGQYVLGVEEVLSKADDSRKNQCSAVVYEFAGSLIKDVWYYPAFDCE